MCFTSFRAQRHVREYFTQHQKQEQEQDHRHDDHVMTDTDANVQPAAMVTDQEEKVLKHCNITTVFLVQ